MAKGATHGRRQLELFVGREAQIRRFLERLHEQEPSGRILFFHGGGGNGKSLLLWRLQEAYALWLPNLAELRELSDDEVARQAAAVRMHLLPSAFLDFATSSQEDNPKDSVGGPLLLRKLLGVDADGQPLEPPLQTPLFTLALVRYLKAKDRLPDDWNKILPTEELDLCNSLIQALSEGLPFADCAHKVLGVFHVRFRDSLRTWMLQRGIDREDVQEIQRMDPDRELLDELPRLLARDLNQWLASDQTPSRAVVFVDTHEALRAEDRLGARFQQDELDRWLRSFLQANLEGGGRVLPVMAGRETPKWEKAAESPIAKTSFDLANVEHFSVGEAQRYLDRAGIVDGDLREAMIGIATVRAGEIHPFLLGLTLDLVEEAARQGEALKAANLKELAGAKEDQLIARILKYAGSEVETAVKALAAARSFDADLYYRLADSLRFPGTRAALEGVTSYSFVWRAPGGRFRVHDLLRRLWSERRESLWLEGHRELEALYRERTAETDPAALAEAIYHANHLGDKPSLTEWSEAMDQVVANARIVLGQALVDVAVDLRLGGEFDAGIVRYWVGVFLSSLSRHEAALGSYTTAIAAYEAALERSPNSVWVHNNKGLALRLRGNLEARLSRHEAALESYTAAVVACEATLELAPDLAEAHNNKGIALESRGKVEVGLSWHAAALRSYTAAIGAHETALELAPDYVDAHNSKGNALLARGELQLGLSQHEAALGSYTAAIAAYEAALERAPDSVRAHNNKGNALRMRGELETTLSQPEAALGSYTAAITSYEAALELAPDLIPAQNNKGTALLRRGELESKLGQHEAALGSYMAAIMACEAALELAPEYVLAHNNKGNALARRGELEASLSRHKAALGSYTAAIEAYETALKLAPDSVRVHNNRGNALRMRGDLEARLSHHRVALGSYTAAIEAYGAALGLAPNYVDALVNRATTHWLLGELRGQLKDGARMCEDYQAAAVSLRRVLGLAPADAQAGKLLRLVAERLQDLGC